MPLVKPNVRPQAMSVWRLGFWDCRRGKQHDPRFAGDSAMCDRYRDGYLQAAINPTAIEPWCYSQARLTELAIESAINATKKLKLPDSELQRNAAVALIAGWRELLESKPWKKELRDATDGAKK